MGFLLGSCGVGLALTSEICLKGLPKTPAGEIMQYKGQETLSKIIKTLLNFFHYNHFDEIKLNLNSLTHFAKNIPMYCRSLLCLKKKR